MGGRGVELRKMWGLCTCHRLAVASGLKFGRLNECWDGRGGGGGRFATLLNDGWQTICSPSSTCDPYVMSQDTEKQLQKKGKQCFSYTANGLPMQFLMCLYCRYITSDRMGRHGDLTAMCYAENNLTSVEIVNLTPGQGRGSTPRSRKIISAHGLIRWPHGRAPSRHTLQMIQQRSFSQSLCPPYFQGLGVLYADVQVPISHWDLSAIPGWTDHSGKFSCQHQIMWGIHPRIRIVRWRTTNVYDRETTVVSNQNVESRN